MAGEKNRWLPFTSGEVHGLIAVLGTALALAAFFDVTGHDVVIGSFGLLIPSYFAAQLVRLREEARTLRFVSDGALKGTGFIEAFRRVKKCLYLMHVDLDPPGPELQGLYRRLLEEGIQIRRLVVLRKDTPPGAYDWIVAFGDHPNLQHRIIPPSMADAVRTSFVLVDGESVLFSVPGTEPIDGPPYAPGMILRHLVEIRDPTVARAFLRAHEDLWQAGVAIADVAELSSRQH